MTPNDRPTTAFVLSGGASLGAIQVGMLRALYERGIAPDVIVGTSAGAMNGAFIASRPQTVATADALAAVWRDLRRGQVFPLNPITGLLGFLGARDHLVPASGLRQPDRPPPRARRARGAADPAARRRRRCHQRRGASPLPRPGGRCRPGERGDPRRRRARALAGPHAHGRRRRQQHADLPRRRARRRAHLRAADRARVRTAANRRAARSPWRCTRSACSPSAG